MCDVVLVVVCVFVCVVACRAVCVVVSVVDGVVVWVVVCVVCCIVVRLLVFDCHSCMFVILLFVRVSIGSRFCCVLYSIVCVSLCCPWYFCICHFFEWLFVFVLELMFDIR